MAKKIFVILLGAFLITSGIFVYKRYFQNKEGLFVNLPGPLTGPKRPSRAENLQVTKIIEWTNYYRQQNGLKPLNDNILLQKAAETKAQDMFLRQYFEHTSPTGEGAADLVLRQGYHYKFVGENLALGDFIDEKDLVDAWMASEGHRHNILSPDYQEIGVAAVLGQYEGRTTWISVQEFATPMPQCVAPSATLKKQIDEGKTKSAQMEKLVDEGNRLIEAGNEKIKQGNEIFAATANQVAAQPYYEEGQKLQAEGQKKINEAKKLQAEIANLENLINQYNQQVRSYNQCISQ